MLQSNFLRTYLLVTILSLHGNGLDIDTFVQGNKNRVFFGICIFDSVAIHILNVQWVFRLSSMARTNPTYGFAQKYFHVNAICRAQ